MVGKDINYINLYPMKKQDFIINYYKKQSVVYDFTRPIFLFGRNKLVNWIAEKSPKGKLLEIGCGTGYLLNKISKKTELELTGVDLSDDMLKIARKKLSNDTTLVQSDIMDYEISVRYDFIILSYIFTLDFVNSAIQMNKIKSLLKPNGRVYVVDFHKYGSKLYQKYMNWHGIEMNDELLISLESNFRTNRKIIRRAYGGIWKYFLFEGQNV